MVTFEATIQGKKVKMFADLPLKNAAGAIVRTLVQISQKTNIFTGKFVMCFGWAYFFLDKRQDENGEEYWVVQTTDYKKNPMNDKTDNVTVSLLVQNMQIETVQTAKVQPLAATFKDTVLVLKEAMTAKDVYMNRTEAEKEGDSGWYFGLLDDPNEENHSADDYIVIATYEFLKFRSEALRVLEMPVGTVAVFHENTLTALVDKDDNPLKFTTPPKDSEKNIYNPEISSEDKQPEEAVSENKE
ncbi:MAG: hypothetical protein ACI4GV_01660 [Acutalibacteraceae bacterium]